MQIPTRAHACTHACMHVHMHARTHGAFPGDATADLVFHLEVLHKVEVGEHPDCAQRRFQVRQLEVAEAEVGDSQGLGRRHHGGLGSGERTDG